MSDLTKEELKIIYKWGYKYVCDDPGFESGDFSDKILDKIQSMIDDYPEELCDHRSNGNCYSSNGEITSLPTHIYVCRYCDKLYECIFKNGICVSYKDLPEVEKEKEPGIEDPPEIYNKIYNYLLHAQLRANKLSTLYITRNEMEELKKFLSRTLRVNSSSDLESVLGVKVEVKNENFCQHEWNISDIIKKLTLKLNTTESFPIICKKCGEQFKS